MLRCQGPDESNSFVTKFVTTAPALRGKVVFIILVLVAQQQLQTCKGLLQGFADKRARLQTKLMS